MHKWFSRVYFAVLENHGWSQVQDCNFVKWFSANGAIFPHWYAAAHPSGPNYRALLSGNTWSLNEFDDVRRGNIANHIPSAVVDYAGAAADRHNPFKDMQASMVDGLRDDAGIVYYGMDDAKNAHSGSLAIAATNVMALIAGVKLGADEAFFLFFDEAFGLEYGTNHVFAAVTSPALAKVKPVISAAHSHRDFAAMLNVNWDLPLLAEPGAYTPLFT